MINLNFYCQLPHKMRDNLHSIEKGQNQNIYMLTSILSNKPLKCTTSVILYKHAKRFEYRHQEVYFKLFQARRINSQSGNLSNQFLHRREIIQNVAPSCSKLNFECEKQKHLTKSSLYVNIGLLRCINGQTRPKTQKYDSSTQLFWRVEFDLGKV